MTTILLHSKRQVRESRSVRSSRPLYAVLLLLVLYAVQPAWAHNGPPYPIMQDQPIGPLKVAVWSNPDVGTGSFFVMLDPGKGIAVPADIKVRVGVQPVSGRLPEKFYDAWREDLRNQVEFKTVVPFDQQERWRVRILLTSTTVTGEAQTEVEVTPPGLGRWDLLLYLLPFLGIALLWFKAAKTNLSRKNRMHRKNRAAGKSCLAPKT